MNQEKQIDKQAVEEMAKELCQLDRDCEECSHNFMCQATKYANRAYDAGYRKQREGYWFVLEYEYFTCSECGYYHPNDCDSTKEAKEKLADGKVPKYCSECGSKMMGGV